MPLFVFISGYFSKNVSVQRKKEIDTLLYPFFVFQILNLLLSPLPGMEKLSLNIFSPYHQNWYILSLFFWRLVIPYSKFLDKRIVIFGSIVLALFVGVYSDFGRFLALYKTVYFAPFFILGYYLDDLKRLVKFTEKYKILFISFFVLLFTCIFFLSMSSDTVKLVNWAFKAEIGYNGSLLLFVCRTAALFVSIVSSLSFVCILNLICKNIKAVGNYTKGLGGTMVLFLIHEFFMMPLLHVILRCGIIAPFLCLISTIILFVIFTNKKITRWFDILIDMSKLTDKIQKRYAK